MPTRGRVPGDTPPPDASRCIPFTGVAAYGTSGDDELRDVTVTRDGSILIAGYENGRSGALGSTIDSRGVVLEYRNGFTQRAVLDTLGTDAFESLAFDPENERVWVAARTNQTLPGFPGRGGFDFVVGDLATTGFRPMARGFDSTPEYTKQLAVGGGLVALAGHEERLMPDDSTWINPFAATFAATDGMPAQWLTTRRNADVERYTAIDVSPSSVVIGGTVATGELPGMFIAARDHDAGSLWQRRTSTVGLDEIAAVRVLPDGDVIWAGTTSAMLGETAHGGKDIVVGKLEGATGAAIWIAQYGTDRDDHAADIAIDGTGRIYVAGSVTEATSSDRDAFLLVLDEAGTEMSSEQWSSSGDDVPTALALDECGTAVIVGSTTGDIAGHPQGGLDGFMLAIRVPGRTNQRSTSRSSSFASR